MSRKPMLIGTHTYGYYYPDTKSFSCSHGAWESECLLVSDKHCKLTSVSKEPIIYEFLDNIPVEFNYT